MSNSENHIPAPTPDEKLMQRALAVLTDLHYNGKSPNPETYNVHSALVERLAHVRT